MGNPLIPLFYQFVLLALISYRVWRLVAEDEILEPPRRWLVRLPQTWDTDDPVPKAYRDKLANFITCPWCAGAWISLIIYILWMATLGEFPNSWDDVLVAFGVWFALSASVGLIRVNLDPPEE